jgi:hypothetical protein
LCEHKIRTTATPIRQSHLFGTKRTIDFTNKFNIVN